MSSCRTRIAAREILDDGDYYKGLGWALSGAQARRRNPIVNAEAASSARA